MENWDLDSIEHIEDSKLLFMNWSNSVPGIIITKKQPPSCFFVDPPGFEPGLFRTKI